MGANDKQIQKIGKWHERVFPKLGQANVNTFVRTKKLQEEFRVDLALATIPEASAMKPRLGPRRRVMRSAAP